MAITLSPETQALIEQRMNQAGETSADRIVQLALETLDGVEAGPLESLDEATLAAIEQATAEDERGEGRPWEEVRDELWRKYVDR